MSDAEQQYLVALATEGFVRGDLEIKQLESVVESILRGRPVCVLLPGERVLRTRADVLTDEDE